MKIYCVTYLQVTRIHLLSLEEALSFANSLTGPVDVSQVDLRTQAQGEQINAQIIDINRREYAD